MLRVHLRPGRRDDPGTAPRSSPTARSALRATTRSLRRATSARRSPRR
jgi:hypothetical protein